jgi:hypothetical protein
MSFLPSGPSDLCKHAVQGSSCQRNLEIVAAEPAGAVENRICGCVEAGCIGGGVGQCLLRLRYTPRLMREAAEREPGRTDSVARRINDSATETSAKA